MEWGQQMRKHEHVARDATYNNTNYMNSRETKIPLIIDLEETVDDFLLSNGDKFSVKLMEPLIIDDLSDIYLDSCMTMNCRFSDGKDNMAIVVKIDQFNINTRSASTFSNNVLNNALVISNEFNNINDHNTTILHKGKKMNYVSPINPTKLSQFTGRITNLAGVPIFPQLLHYVQIEALVEAIPKGTGITVGDFVGEFAADHSKGATDMFFITTTKGTVNHNSNLSYVFDGKTNKAGIVSTHIPGEFPRIILEFLIVNRK